MEIETREEECVMSRLRGVKCGQCQVCCDELKGRIAELVADLGVLKSEVMPMRKAFGRLRFMLRLSDVADIASVVRCVSGKLDALYAAESEVTRLEGMLRISADTNSKLICQIADERKEGE